MTDSQPRARPYRSRRQRPCDLCRSRRVCCTRSRDDLPCALCQTRGIACTYRSGPVQRRAEAQSETRPKARVARSPCVAHTSNSASVEPAEDGQIEQMTMQFVGWSGDQDPDLLSHGHWKAYCVDGVKWECRRVDTDDGVPAHFSMIPDEHLDAYPSSYPSTHAMELATAGLDSYLLRAFFDFINSSYYLLDEASFIPENAPATLLASIYALALPFCPEAKNLNRRVFLDFNDQALHLGRRNAKLHTIEAALLYVQRHIYVFRAPTTPGLTAETGSLIGMSFDVGLNVDPSGWAIDVAEKQRRKRLWWSVYMHDKWSALTLGRPSYISDDDCSVPMITLTDFGVVEKHLSTEKGILSASIFIAMAELSVILSDILKNFYTLQAIRNNHQVAENAMTVRVSQLSYRLQVWWSEHQSCLYAPEHVFPDSTGTPALAYHTVQIVLHRAALRTHENATSRERATFHLLEVIVLLRNLRASRIRSFWWAMSRINSSIVGASLYHMLLSSVEDEDVALWMARIQEYHMLLQAQSVSFDVTKLAAIRLGLLRN